MCNLAPATHCLALSRMICIDHRSCTVERVSSPTRPTTKVSTKSLLEKTLVYGPL